MILKYLLVITAAYLIGSFSMSIILSKYVYHDDVRKHGSGNAGATNIARTFGWGPGILTFLCDFLKCAIAMEIGMRLLGDPGKCAAGIACLIGHCFPVYFNFKGGKAVSTGACVGFLIDWKIFLAMIIVFAVTALITKIVSISSILAALTTVVMAFIINLTLPMRILAIFAGILVIFMHYPNIVRLLNGTESKFKAGSRPKKQ
ncbi:MAG: glycerol-3-phosphate 1-O-acyltransferase PlsY [Eubacteriales bacterium]|nr:glycerol-3-phosphate 1-O-acyltransferase PlsY [Eubacteriales bacterium]